MIEDTDTKPLSLWIPMTNTTDCKVVGKMLEELGECTSAVARCFIQGIDGSEPITGKSNRDWLTEEVADAFAVLYRCSEHFELNQSEISRRINKKLTRFRKWAKM